MESLFWIKIVFPCTLFIFPPPLKFSKNHDKKKVTIACRKVVKWHICHHGPLGIKVVEINIPKLVYVKLHKIDFLKGNKVRTPIPLSCGESLP
jgi:hypothetical protein